jgi:hypothetical protein
MRRKTGKRSKIGIKRYTAVVPKTMRATKAVGTAVVNKINYFLSATRKTIKNTAKAIDRKTAKSIRTFTKRRIRR